MEHLPLVSLVQFVSPDWLRMLKEEEQSQLIVVRDGIRRMSEEDLIEIVEAVIKEKRQHAIYH
ncbi:hypothetical protein CR205_00760 [Alteribacter lacisalsi]|jgi:hypothetical protein|uniref:Uncharacterized protein n=1 Tax=Alteribacter lacisalsi TaxID=2045244 RepID=A0A2W0HI80_9BACI|nr:hypothetical protein [Alteribacter lacisalsi]PYZ97165.1 hypothetical protein CR205_00760 [Alteribacter lacisalsi]